MGESGEASGRRKASYFFDVGRRETGSSVRSAYSRRIGGSEGLLMRMNQYGQLPSHTKSVYNVSFSPAGDFLVSTGDTDITLWDWLAKTKKLMYPSGHQDHIFDARVLPFTNDSTIVTVSADGQVRLGQLKEDGDITTKQIGAHDDNVRKLAFEPGSPHIFYSCGDDSLVQHFDLRSDSPTKLFTCYSFSHNARRVRLSTIAIDPQNPSYFSVGGSEEYARLYDMRKIECGASGNQPVDTFCPKHLVTAFKRKRRTVIITGVAYSYAKEILVSYGDDFTYLFQNDMGLGPDPRSAQPNYFDILKQPQAYTGHRNFRTFKEVRFFGPNDEYVLSGSDCGNIFVWRKKGGQLMRMMHGDKTIVRCIEPHPHFPFLATSGSDDNIKIWTPGTAIRKQ